MSKVQASKRQRAIMAAQNGNKDMAHAFREFRKGSRTSPHRDKSRYSRNDFRREKQAMGY